MDTVIYGYAYTYLYIGRLLRDLRPSFVETLPPPPVSLAASSVWLAVGPAHPRFLRRCSFNHFNKRTVSIYSFCLLFWFYKLNCPLAHFQLPPKKMVVPLPNPCKNSLSCASSVHGSRSRSASPKTPLGTSKISSWTLPKIEQARLRFVDSVGRKPVPRLEALMMTQEFSNIELETLEINDNGLDLFEGMKHRFLRFKKHQFLENNVHFQNLSQSQAPKFMVIACADSRVCPSNILGFQPGEAFTIRNVANLVPPFENGPTETNAALEFAVNSLEVGNIFVIGHSCCGGIRALMSMPDEVDSGNSSFIRDWVIVGKGAKLSTKTANADLSFEQQCRHCEKESVNRSLLNLLTYPWIEKRVKEGILSLHGGYYDFVNCSFEKWTLDYRGRKDDGVNYTIRDRSCWS